MTLGVFLWLTISGVCFASFCGALLGVWVGAVTRPASFEIGRITLSDPSESAGANPSVMPFPRRKSASL